MSLVKSDRPTNTLTLTLYVIHTESLRARQQNVQGAVKAIEDVGGKAGWRVDVQYVLTPNPSDLAIKDLEARIKYEPTGDAELDAHMHTLNVQELSNLEKHRSVWRTCAEKADNSLNMVIEDDVTFVPGSSTESKGLADLFELWAKTPPSATDHLIPLCLARPARIAHKLWHSKEAYVVTPTGARGLFAATQQIRFNARGHLSFWAATHAANVHYPTDRLTVDGSKLGLFPSSIHTHNPLVFNRDYMEMLELANGKVTLDVGALEATLNRYWTVAASMRSPDLCHLLGVLYHRAGKNDKARQLFLTALQEMAARGGLLTTGSEIMTNAINIHKFLQADLATACASTASLKYSDTTALL